MKRLILSLICVCVLVGCVVAEGEPVVVERPTMTSTITRLAPTPFVTPVITQTPEDNGYAQMYETGYRLAELIMAMPIPFTYEYQVNEESVFIYTPDPEEWMVEAVKLEEIARKGEGTPLPFSLEDVELRQSGEVIVIEPPVMAQTELWTTELLQDNRWRVAEAVRDGVPISYETLSLSRFEVNDALQLFLSVPCNSSGSYHDSAGIQLALDEEAQTITAYAFAYDLRGKICGDQFSDKVKQLFYLLFDMETVTWTNEQLIFAGEQGRLVLLVDNAPILFDTPPPPTAYP